MTKKDPILKLVQSGFAGIDENGKIVDRRIVRNAIPIERNELLGVPKPKRVIENESAENN